MKVNFRRFTFHRGLFFPALAVLLIFGSIAWKEEFNPSQNSGIINNSVPNQAFLPLVNNGEGWANCSQSNLGALLFTEQTSGESTGPYLESLNQEGYRGMVGTPNYDLGAEYFDILQQWRRVLICNSHDCLRQRAERASIENLEYEYLSYGPERLEGVPPEEKFNLPWATQAAREIADEWRKSLIISYSTKQLHQEAEERGYPWDDPSEVIAMLAPYGDVWMIQAADEYWRMEDNTVRPILSQRVYPPGEEFRAEVEKWVNWITAANPEIEIWIQLGLQRIGIEGENEPSAKLLLEYRESIADLVSGVYITPIYGSIEQLPIANQEMVKVFKQACGEISTQDLIYFQPTSNSTIALVEEGWTDDLSIPCPPTGSCMTILPGYYYRIYENSKYPCGSQGNHQFMVLDHGNDPNTQMNLFAKFLGGAVGFWYLDSGGNPVYYPNENAAGVLNASQNRNMFFRTSVSEEFAGGVTKKFRENKDYRILVPSYCSHDLYFGKGEYNSLDGFTRWGYYAAMEAVDYVQENFNTQHIITYGGSAGAAGSFYIGKDQVSVKGIILDSQAVDLSAISQACYDGFNVFGNAYPCFCPEGGQTCMEVLSPRIGFTFFVDEPYKIVKQGFDKPIYYVWNERDASIYAHMQFDNLQTAIEQHNPGDNSIANKVCITDPRTPPGPICNLHVPSAYDFPETDLLVNHIYQWGLMLTGFELNNGFYLPVVEK